ncbi:hypothetical protein AUEXF2481DRAFT_422174 [Aureobasidium subglaciale EXF-2481]|uniref:Zn(2)-C6 fungal-type domain-containing protein n=1 Tax=Aureobasidium subglaciale (strain EXF-2481) TaxID=1043005 RepID=A0A074Z0C3_AURSE|nr:uncharacterized protein AUEXF2481DRAFT_422174 [Aureobasidium subglaciale EXF-2481]KAI5197080.1 hypothetical protein E4T38_08205 [Aureobasidium subglaciale]KAI5215792.1 hypothetical protein E4T40_08215 [Aureobasidium subglaciale]KAI5219051.1 hypothetical protein E4T41_08130 [Aureobasidium subglaciale]KAI5256614.1 hypothetical protein E4T46_08106 [Aureobasidium subglaciale]KEQ92541.1 hypothetical protein AUEXF2481DRAFT_422174 [Aureobasidium subglaciale EXF-2481]
MAQCLSVSNEPRSFVSNIICAMDPRRTFAQGQFVCYIDPTHNATWVKFYPAIGRLDAQAIKMWVFDCILYAFNARNGGYPLSQLRLLDCEIRGSSFSFLVNPELWQVRLKNVHIFEGEISDPFGTSFTPKAPAFWEIVLPVLLLAGLRDCHLRGLKDDSTAQRPDHWGEVVYTSNDAQEIPRVLFALANGLRPIAAPAPAPAPGLASGGPGSANPDASQAAAAVGAGQVPAIGAGQALATGTVQSHVNTGTAAGQGPAAPVLQGVPGSAVLGVRARDTRPPTGYTQPTLTPRRTCEQCKRNRKHCDLAFPECGQCVAHDYDCYYLRG